MLILNDEQEEIRTTNTFNEFVPNRDNICSVLLHKKCG